MNNIDISLLIFSVIWLAVNGVVFFSKHMREKIIQSNERKKGFLGRLGRTFSPWHYSHEALRILSFLFILIGIMMFLCALNIWYNSIIHTAINYSLQMYITIRPDTKMTHIYHTCDLWWLILLDLWQPWSPQGDTVVNFYLTLPKRGQVLTFDISPRLLRSLRPTTTSGVPPEADIRNDAFRWQNNQMTGSALEIRN